MCQSNIYKSNHILKALGELAGQKNATLQPFLKGRLLLFSEIPPAPCFPGSPGFRSLVCYDSAPNSVKELCSPPAWARSQNSFPHDRGGQSWALLPKVRERDRSSGRKALPSGVLSPWLGVMPKDSLAALPPHTPLIWLYRRDFSRYTFFLFF